MDSQSSSSSAGDGQYKLTRLVFEEPTPIGAHHYTTNARYTNDENQAFRVQIHCRNKQALDRYTPEVNVHFSLRPATSDDPPPAGKQQGHQGTVEPASPPTNSGGPEGTADLDISIHVEDSAGIEPPYVLDFTIDPLIGLDEFHRYGLSNVHSVRMNATGVENKVKVIYAGKTHHDPAVLEQNRSADPPFVEPTSASAFSFTITIQGMEGTSKYTLNGNIGRDRTQAFEGPGAINKGHV